MTNILSEKQKKSLRKEYRFRFFVVVFMLIFLTGVLFSILLVPAFFLAKTKIKSVETNLAELKRSSALNSFDILDEDIKKTKEQIDTLNVTDSTNGSDAISAIINAKTPGILLTRFIRTELSDKKHQIALSGVALNRESLKTFANSLLLQDLLSDVNVPISNFTKDKDIVFSITVKEKN